MKMKTMNITVYPIIIPTKLSLQSFNFYLVELKNSLLLVDAGVNRDEYWDLFLVTLSKHSLQISDIDKIVLTHSHEDHTGLVNRIIKEHPIPVYAHIDGIKRLKRDPEYLTSRIAFFANLYDEMGCGDKGKARIEELKSIFMENQSKIIAGDILPLKEGDWIDELQVIEIPGHWPDHIGLFHQPSGSFFAGDHIVRHISSNALIEPDVDGRRLPTLSIYEQSLKKCQALPLKTIYPGHGKIIHDPISVIERRLEGIERKAMKLLDVIKSLEPCTAAEVAQTFYKQVYESEFALVMSEIIGHMDRLEAKGKIKKEKKGGVWLYATTLR